jgi:hypothetical protein
MNTKVLYTIVGLQVIIIFVGLLNLSKPQTVETTISSVCVKEDTKTTICYCSV